MGKKTVRNDLLVTCPECGRKLRPCNLGRHVLAAHPGTAAARWEEQATARLALAMHFDRG